MRLLKMLALSFAVGGGLIVWSLSRDRQNNRPQVVSKIATEQPQRTSSSKSTAQTEQSLRIEPSPSPAPIASPAPSKTPVSSAIPHAPPSALSLPFAKDLLPIARKAIREHTKRPQLALAESASTVLVEGEILSVGEDYVQVTGHGENVFVRGTAGRYYVGDRHNFGLCLLLDRVNYPTLLGQASGYVVAQIRDEAWQQAIAYAESEREYDSAREAESKLHEARKRLSELETRVQTWTDASGSFGVDAVLVDRTDESLTLRRTDGTQVTVATEKLSDASRDQAFSISRDRARQRTTIERMTKLLDRSKSQNTMGE